jgi:hypothetical protein
MDILKSSIKKCSKCKKEKSLEHFHRSKKSKDGTIARCKNCRSTESSALYKSNIDTYRKRNRESYYRNNYGVDPIIYDVLAVQQKYKCAICQETPSLLRLDHDHTTGFIRQLLCHNCNVGLGHFRDSIDLLLKAKEYLERHGKTKKEF